MSFKLMLKEMHPGVAEMDAIYSFYCEHNGKIYEDCSGAQFMLFADDSDVKVNGADIIVPYFVRQQKRTITVKAVLNHECSYVGGEPASDEYKLSFSTVFKDEPSLFDDFDTLDRNVWQGGEAGWEYRGAKEGYVENSNLVLPVSTKQPIIMETTSKSFKQTYGSFTACMKFPEYTTTPCASNCAFWLCSNVMDDSSIMFKKNPKWSDENCREHAGEFDIIEYSAAFGDFGTASVHWYGWTPGMHQQSGKGGLPMPGIRDGYHKISLVWEPNAIYWYYDGKLTRVYRGEGVEGVGEKPGAEMVVLFQHNRCKGDSWEGVTVDEDGVLKFCIDWVKVYPIK